MGVRRATPAGAHAESQQGWGEGSEFCLGPLEVWGSEGWLFCAEISRASCTLLSANSESAGGRTPAPCLCRPLTSTPLPTRRSLERGHNKLPTGPEAEAHEAATGFGVPTPPGLWTVGQWTIGAAPLGSSGEAPICPCRPVL